jgi:hypothetical protein
LPGDDRAGGRGYADALGWIQLVESSDAPGGFAIDPFEPLGEMAHPFCFFGFAPTLFDGPSRANREDMTWRARTFLAEIDEDFEAFAIIGFAWGFTIPLRRGDDRRPCSAHRIGLG